MTFGQSDDVTEMLFIPFLILVTFLVTAIGWMPSAGRFGVVRRLTPLNHQSKLKRDDSTQSRLRSRSTLCMSQQGDPNNPMVSFFYLYLGYTLELHELGYSYRHTLISWNVLLYSSSLLLSTSSLLQFVYAYRTLTAIPKRPMMLLPSYRSTQTSTVLSMWRPHYCFEAFSMTKLV